MNQLISRNQKLQVTSQDIAELVGSRHDKVKQSIIRLASAHYNDDGTVKRPALISQPPVGDGEKSANGSTTKVFIFSGDKGRRDSIVVVAQLSPEFTARLVDRWQELESQVSQPKIPKNYAEALQLAADQAKQLEIAAPKAEFYDRVVERETLINATQVAQKVGLSAVMMNRALDEIGGIYSKSTKRGRVFIQEFIHKGYGILRMTESGHAQPLFTTAGEARVIELLTNEGCI